MIAAQDFYRLATDPWVKAVIVIIAIGFGVLGFGSFLGILNWAMTRAGGPAWSLRVVILRYRVKRERIQFERRRQLHAATAGRARPQ